MKTTDYVGNIIYENGTLSMILTGEGYITLSGTTPTYHYYLKDHQGNNRVVVNQSGTVTQVNHYYPFGGVFGGEGTDTAKQPFKYNDKEFDRTNGLDWYDYSARFMDASLGRFTTVDPLAEKYYGISPYVYCANNPVRYVDPDGRKIRIGTFWGRVRAYFGANNYESRVQNQLNELKEMSPILKGSIEMMEASDKTITITNDWNKKDNPGNHIKVQKNGNSEIRYDFKNNKTNAGKTREPIIGLAHELGHAEDIMEDKQTSFDKRKVEEGDVGEIEKMNRNEINAISNENIVREKLGVELRSYEYYKHNE